MLPPDRKDEREIFILNTRIKCFHTLSFIHIPHIVLHSHIYIYWKRRHEIPAVDYIIKFQNCNAFPHTVLYLHSTHCISLTYMFTRKGMIRYLRLNVYSNFKTVMSFHTLYLTHIYVYWKRCDEILKYSPKLKDILF